MKIIRIIMSAIIYFGTMGIYAQERVVRLDELFVMADEHNHTLKTTSATIDEANSAIQISKGERLPSVDVSLSFSYLGDAWIADRDLSNGMNADMPHFGNNFSIEAVQVLYAGGAIRRSIELAELNKTMSELKHQGNIQSVRMLLAGCYLDMFKLYNQRQIYLKNIEQTEMLLSDIKASYNAGTALKSDITRYELQIESLKLALIQIDNTMNIINRQLVTAVGLSSEMILKPDTSLLGTIISYGTEEEWQRLVSESPEMKMSQLGIDITKQGERIVRSKKMPSIALVVGDKFDGPIVIEVPPIDKNLNYWYVGIGVKYAIGSLYKQNREIKQARVATTIAQEQHLETVDKLQNNVHAAYIRLKESFSVIDTREKSLQLAEENYDVIHYRYLNGMALITDMLDASNQKLTAELQLVNARVALVFSHCYLRSVVGIL